MKRYDKIFVPDAEAQGFPEALLEIKNVITISIEELKLLWEEAERHILGFGGADFKTYLSSKGLVI